MTKGKRKGKVNGGMMVKVWVDGIKMMEEFLSIFFPPTKILNEMSDHVYQKT